MWVQIKSASNLIMAEMWKEFFEGEGIPTRILVEDNSTGRKETAAYRVLVPQEKEHVIEEILRKA